MENALNQQLLLSCNTEINLEKVKSLVKKGANINYIINGMTPLLAITNQIVCNYQPNRNKPETTEEYYPEYYKLFLWVLRNGHKHINRQYSYQRTSPDSLFRFLLEYGDYIMIREAFIYVDKPYQYISYEILQEIFEPDSYDILKFLTNCSKLVKSLSSSASENIS